MQDQILEPHESSSHASPIAGTLVLIALGLLPLFVLPVNGFPFALSKTTLFSLLLAVGAVTLGLSALRRGSLSLPSSKLFLALGGLVGAYALASVLSQDWKLSLVGSGAEVDTLLFMALAALTAVLVTTLFSAKESAHKLLTVLGISAAIVALFQFARIWAGSLFEGGVFGTATSNLVGGWNDFGTTMGMLALLCAASLDARRSSFIGKLVALLGLLASLFLAAVVNLSVLWWALALAGLCVAYARFSGAQEDTAVSSRIPFASLVLVVVSVVFIVWGPQLAPRVQQLAPAQQIEAQLTLPTTIEVTRATYAQSALTTFFGSGPNTFAQQWLLYKPASLTNSDFWTLDFGAGFSTIATAFLTAGLVGGLLFLAIPLLFLAFFFRNVRHVYDPHERDILVAAGGAAIFLFAMLAVYAPGQVVALLAFAMLGLAAAFGAYRKEHHLALSGLTGKLVLAVIILACVAGAAALGQRFLSGVYQGRALVAASEGNMALAQANAMRALSTLRSEEALHLLATLKFSEAQTIAAETDKATEGTRANRLQAALSDASVYATAAAQSFPTHWGNWLTLAQLYEALIPLKVEGAYQQSAIAYANAIRLSPRNPELYLMVARMEASAGNEQNARNAVSQALTLKQNYTDAILFIVQLEVAKKNIDGALNAAAAAVQTSPNNAGLWFQLGVLAYEKGDDATAAGALKQAVTLVPDYANAKFFLGLAYYRQGKVGDAVALFEELARQNPDNAQVTSILADMKSGKPAPAPTTAPVKEK